MCTAILVAVALVVIVGALTVLRASAPSPNAEMLAVLLDEMLDHYAASRREGGRDASPADWTDGEGRSAPF
ncbi:hypothetical protein [Pseudodesulfovibrio sp.]|uniref:hypothetical protein n=1 Tax=Pseudodesulfovibrio sp. TaxID=2035812 RepID=UPI002621753C|nr:hypothetical protein [Pseudodesulfovibrio sp.]MDD3310557.1 hypothetical protein [Pseudodesulfovibrio sp.]